VTTPGGVGERLLAIQRAFDEAFAMAPRPSRGTFEDLLAVRLAGDPYALRLRDIAGLVVSRKVVPLPSGRPELLGVTGHRGSIVAVYSLAALLGYGTDSKPTPWLALAGGSEPVGLAFEELEGFLRLPSGDVHTASPGEGARPFAGEVVLVGSLLRRVVDIPSTLATLEVHAGNAGLRKES
jgi:chemotaxis signal transduction protein